MEPTIFRMYFSLGSVGPSLGLRLVDLELLDVPNIKADDVVNTILGELEKIDPDLRTAVLCGNIPIMFSGDKNKELEITDIDARKLIDEIMDGISKIALDLQVHGLNRTAQQLKPPYFGLITWAPSALGGDSYFYDNFNQIHVPQSDKNDAMALAEIVRHPFSITLIRAEGDFEAKVKEAHAVFPTMRTFLIVDSLADMELLDKVRDVAIRTGIRPQMVSSINGLYQVFPGPTN